MILSKQYDPIKSIAGDAHLGFREGGLERGKSQVKVAKSAWEKLKNQGKICFMPLEHLG